MAAPTNILQAVQTVQNKALVMVQNSSPVFSNGDKRFDNFQNFQGQLGDSVSYLKQARATVVRSLTWAEQPSVQRIQTLACDRPYSSSYQYTNQQFLFNVDPLNWNKSWIKSAILNLATEMEKDVCNDFTIYPYRFYGDGRTPITTFNELQTILMRFRNWGSAMNTAKCFLPDFAIPSFVTSGLNQFALDRNNELANSWEISEYSNCKFMQSNLLARHIAGSEGQANSILTVSGVTKDSAGLITAISFTGVSAPNDANSVKKGDRFQITTAGTNLLQFVGYGQSVQPIQFMAAADAASISGTVTVQLATPLYPGQSLSDAISINTDIINGMTANVANSHVAACIYDGDAHQIANPQLPDQDPFATSWSTDPDTGASIRVTFGAQLGQGTSRLGIDAIDGSTMNPDLCMTILFPIAQG